MSVSTTDPSVANASSQTPAPRLSLETSRGIPARTDGRRAVAFALLLNSAWASSTASSLFSPAAMLWVLFSAAGSESLRTWLAPVWVLECVDPVEDCGTFRSALFARSCSYRSYLLLIRGFSTSSLARFLLTCFSASASKALLSSCLASGCVGRCPSTSWAWRKSRR